MNPLKFFRSLMKPRAQYSEHLTLTQRRIYILPGPVGGAFVGVTLILFLVAINYQNNLVFAIACLMVAILLVGMIHTYANMAGLRLSLSPEREYFCDSLSKVNLHVASTNRAAYSINARLKPMQGLGRMAHCEAMGKQTLSLEWRPLERGYVNVPAIRVSSSYPLGLFIAWAWFRPADRVLVFPAPLGSTQSRSLQQGDSSERLQASMTSTHEAGEFSGLREYQTSDSPKHVSWKHVAREQGMWVKVSDTPDVSPNWLDWHDFPDDNVEGRLSKLCYLVLKLCDEQQTVGLKLPDETIPPSMGDEHRIKLLQSLALYLTASSHQGVQR